jgi:hypothetical protein
VKPYTNSVEIHPQPSNNRHPVDDVLVGAGSLWPIPMYKVQEPNIPNNSAGASCKVTTSEQGVPKTDGLAWL